MHIGAGFLFQSTAKPTDPEGFAVQLPLIEQAELLGFDSIWTPEHALSRQLSTSNSAQLLAWMAGKTRKALIGSMVSIEAWHNPIRIAESLSVLDLLSGGRALFGIASGLGPIVFNGSQGPFDRCDARVAEYVRAIASALESGVLSSPGPLYRQPPVAICPQPPYSFRGRTYAMCDSLESARVLAQLGAGLLLVANKPWDTLVQQARDYAALYASIHHTDAPRPILLSLTCVDPDPARARDMQQTYAAAYAGSVVDQGLADLRPDGEAQGVYQVSRFPECLQLSGTPSQVLEASMDRARSLDAAALINVLALDGMPAEVARRNMLTYARDVLPHLKAADIHRTIGRHASTVATTILETV